MKPVPMMPALMVFIGLFYVCHFGPAFFFFRRNYRFKDGNTLGAVQKIRMNFGIACNGIYKIKNGVNESVFIANHMPRRPPCAEVWVRGMCAKNGFEAGFIGGIAAVAIFQL